MEFVVMMVVLGLLMYLMMIRPQQKRMNEQRSMLSQLAPGTRVLLISRVFGTIRATGDTQVVVELAPGVEVTCMKEAIMRVATEADEEFEYTDAEAVEVEQVSDADLADDEQIAAVSEPAVSDDSAETPGQEVAEELIGSGYDLPKGTNKPADSDTERA
ncbi:preprotein translocase, YajC subunit [Propionibacterium sp. oral taxon 192 str. F0372]|uniref:preprotein translocase subunit YajC n=1 Tax=Propionibacterium sp. oral taxon 192 TaxID=671222 RepID=UPI000353C8A5|nr:preprotein translocase subunit YajC [Propionibacterium sp. oral taxon 192]EPH02744.1 preprotein translocase, YajC subunit [Propionibacterium sp. oral taxon 192 str. F0372]